MLKNRDELALVITGKGIVPHDTVHTYNEQAFCLYRSHFEALSQRKEADAVLGDFWIKSNYSARENHGKEQAYYYQAEGIALDGLLQVAGLSEKDLKELNYVTFKSGQEFTVVLDEYSSQKRYCYNPDYSAALPVPPMLSFANTRQSLEGTGDLLIREEKNPVPTLMFGQKEIKDYNKCSYLKNVQAIVLGEENQQIVVQIALNGSTLQRYTIADLLLLEWEEREYIVDDIAYKCTGVDLYNLLRDQIAQNQTGTLAVEITVESQQYLAKEQLQINQILPGKYLLAFYSEHKQTGKKVKNGTALRLYGADWQVPNVSCLELITAALPMPSQQEVTKLPSGKPEQILNAVFYICVTSATGSSYYYFSPEELWDLYGQVTKEYAYNDHTVDKKAACVGVTLADLIASLADVNGEKLLIPDSWKLQFVEEDAYHSTTATYINTLEEIRDYRQSMLVSKYQESFLLTTEYHQDDTCYQYPEKLCVYQKAHSANEAVIKNLMGIVISQSGDGFVPGGYTVVGRDATTGEKLYCSSIQGAMHGMSLGVQAPSIIGCSLIEGEPKAKLVQAGDPKKTRVEFSYTQQPILTIHQQNLVYQKLKPTDFKHSRKQIPESLEMVQEQVDIGTALAISQDNSCGKTGALFVPKPQSNLYIDRRHNVTGKASYGYDQLFLRRYAGIPLEDLLPDRWDCFILLVSGDGKTKEIKKSQLLAGKYFVAEGHSESKGVPNNTGEGKRKQIPYDLPKLINSHTGGVILANLAKIYAI